MRCSKCGSEVEHPAEFCPHCGKRFVAVAEAVPAGGEPGLFYCYKHKHETTRVSCGRCGRPLCTKCMVVGSVGVRCKQCAKNPKAWRPKALLRNVATGATAEKVWYVAVWLVIIDLVASLFGMGRRG